MDDPLSIPPGPPEGTREELPESTPGSVPDSGQSQADQPAAQIATSVSPEFAIQQPQAPGTSPEQREWLRRRSFLKNLYLLLALTLAAFILTAWILVRVDSPFGVFSTGPQEVVRAQLLAVDRGQFRPAYDMFSTRYRGQVSFDLWHELIVTHWRMFHAEVVSAGEPAQAGPGVTLEIRLRDEDDTEYRARFTLIHTHGRWWIDDVRWMQEAGGQDISRT
jgi:hypothetical protein